MGTNDVRVIALDARTGIPCADFGAGGEVKIESGMSLLLAGRVSDYVRAGDKPWRPRGWFIDIRQCPV